MTDPDDRYVLGPRRDRLPDGTVIEIEAVRTSEYPGGVKYSFQHFDPVEGITLLRYDNAHDDPDLGEHHRHGSDLDPADVDRAIELTNVYDHLRTFLDEVHDYDRD